MESGNDCFARDVDARKRIPKTHIESGPPNPLSETDHVHETLTAIIHR